MIIRSLAGLRRDRAAQEKNENTEYQRSRHCKFPFRSRLLCRAAIRLALVRLFGLFLEGANDLGNFTVIRKSAFEVLGKHQLVVDVHVEDAAFSLDQFRRETKSFFNFGRQTGGHGEIVSLSAIFDADFHVRNLAIKTNESHARRQDPIIVASQRHLDNLAHVRAPSIIGSAPQI